MKHRTITHTNKPRATSLKENQWMLIVFLSIIVLLFFNNVLLKAEGTKSLAPSTSDKVALFVGAGNTGSTGGDYGQFAWKGSNSKLSFNIQNTCEKVYFGFSVPHKDRSFRSRNPINGSEDFDKNLIFRIVDPRGVPINNLSCFGNTTIDGEVWQTLRPDEINLASREITDIGPKQLNAGGYDAFELDLSACGLNLTGDYSIEFFSTDSDYNPNTPVSGFYFEYFDVTVGSCTNDALTGRLWSNNWGLAVKKDGDGPFDRAFNGAFYICSKEGFITKIDFNTKTNNRAEAGKDNDQKSGFRAGAFNVSFNTTGPKNTGDIIADRKSVFSANETNPELAVFLNLPDPSFCPPQTIGEFKAKKQFISGCQNGFCINVAFSKPGQVEILLEDNDGNRQFDNPKEVRLVQEVTEANRVANPEDPNFPYEVCMPWDGKDGLGADADFTSIFISGFYFQGIYHFPVYDAEFNDDGFIVETVRPALGVQELFYDDLDIPSENKAGENKDGTNGCVAPCHRWTGEYEDFANRAEIFGNFNTINTWWFGNSTFQDFSFQAIPRPALVCPTDYEGCVGDDISPNTIGSAYVDDQKSGCTVITHMDNIIAENSSCAGDLLIERTWSGYIQGFESETKIECTQLIRLEDKTAPVLSGIPAAETVTCNAVPAPVTDVSATDNCNNLSDLNIAFKEEILGGLCAGNYQIRRTWTATDRCGNTSSAEQLITVVDDVPPVLVGIPTGLTVRCTDVPSVPTTITATDNCEPSGDIKISFEESVTAGSCGGNYTIERRWTAADRCGNQSVASQTITVIDDVAPSLVDIPADQTVTCDAIPAPVTNVSATDNCNALSDLTIAFKEEILSGACAGNYQISRTWTVTDPCGNSSSGEQLITVVDDVAPSLVGIPADQTVRCTDVPNVPTTISATDNCEAIADIKISFEESERAGSCSGNYTIERRWSAVDGCGNQSVAVQIITVIDDVAPNLVDIPADQTVACDAVPAPVTNVSATDNCNALSDLTITFKEEILSGACAGNYQISRTWTVTDPCGNSSSAEQLITVIDDVAPSLVGIPADLTVRCTEVPNVPTNISATDNCEAIADIKISFEEKVTAGACAGDYTIERKWLAVDGCGNQSEGLQIITVIDDVAPVISRFPADETVNCGNIPPVATSVNASDNCEADNDIEFVFSEKTIAGACAGDYTIERTWTATDQCGNTASQTQTITVVDTESPVFQNIPESITVSCDAVPVAATNIRATDNCEAEENIEITFTETEQLGNCSGNYSIERTWTATDQCGNQQSATQVLTIIDITAPILNGVPKDTIVNCHSIPAASEEVIATDNCTAEDGISIDLKEEQIAGDCVGNYTIKRTWTAVDDCGNESALTQTIQVIDTIAPTLIGLPADITVECDAVPAPAIVSATDNCEASEDITIIFKELRLDGNCIGNYILRRAWTATDQCGNFSFGEQQITVEDNTAPTFAICPKDLVVLAEDGCESAVLDIELPSVTDNCEGEIAVTSSADLSQPFPMGTTTVVFTATDECGNATTCEFLVKVENAPQDHCPADILTQADCETDSQTAIITWLPPNGNECCSSCPTNTAVNNFIFLGERGGHRYYLSNQSLNWEEARNQSDAMDGYLVSINDPAENDFLSQFLVESPVYMGLTDNGSLGEYYWQNDEALNYENWGANDLPTTSEVPQFALLSPAGNWTLSDGSKSALFIVEIPCVDVIQLSGPLNGSAFPVGTTTVSYVLDYDNCANRDTCSFDVTVEDCEQFAILEYCESAGIDTTCFWINESIIAGTEVASGPNGGYGDFTDTPINIYTGFPQTIELTPSFAPGHTFNVYWKVWIDYNQNEIFEEEELIFAAREYRPITVNFTVPEMALFGQTRMRISMNFADSDDPCADLAFGEVEDYLINIGEIGENIRGNQSSNGSRNSGANATYTVIPGNYLRPVDGLSPMDIVSVRAANLSVFPNPAKTELILNIDNYNLSSNTAIVDKSEVAIYNQMGQVVYQTTLKTEVKQQAAIDIAHLESGIYFVQVKLGQAKVLKQKFIKME